MRAWLHLSGRTIVPLSAIMAAGLAVAACNPAPTQPTEPAHEKHLTEKLIAQRIMYCDDGARADVDFIDDGLKMAVTWLPNGRTEILRAQRTGEEFRGDQSRAVVAGGAIAFMRRGKISVCHRTPEKR
nr:hypothetical protein [Sphingomonas hominis]